MKIPAHLILAAALLPAVFSCSSDPMKLDPVPPQEKEEKQPEEKPDPQTVTVVDYSLASLGELAEKQGILLGTAFNYWGYLGNAQVPQILSREFKSVTMENEMKHNAIVQPDGRMDFKTADQMVQWAKEADTQLFGHVLGWHSQQQTQYLNTLTSDPAALDAAFKSFVYGMVEHFDTYAWDVVNETFADGGDGAFRTKGNSAGDFVWGNYYGSTRDWVDKAFEYAAGACSKYGKKPVLYINDYNLETDPGKRRGLCDYAKSNPRVTGVASQMHLDMATPDLKAKIEASLKDLTATGKMVRIAELDLKCKDEAAQAEMFKYIFQKYLEIVPQAQRGGITFWGINDKDSWVGEENAPLLWKGNSYLKKQGYETLYVYLCELNGINPYKEVEI